MLKAWLTGVTAWLYRCVCSVTPCCLCVTALSPPGGSWVSFQDSSIHEPTTRPHLFVSISCNPTGNISYWYGWLSASSHASLLVKQVLQARCWHPLHQQIQLCAGWQAWVMLMGWHKWKRPCSLCSADSSVHAVLKREGTPRARLPCLPSSTCLSAIQVPSPLG